MQDTNDVATNNNWIVNGFYTCAGAILFITPLSILFVITSVAIDSLEWIDKEKKKKFV